MEYEPKFVWGPKGPVDLCGCQFCDNEWQIIMNVLDPDGWLSRACGIGMILCPECGCKRCPKATYHGHECTGSNESGQSGSVYGDFILRSEDEDD